MKRKTTHAYVVHELYWNASPMHRDPTMAPLTAESFEKLPKEGVGGYYHGLPGPARKIVSVTERALDNPWIILLELSAGHD